MLKAILGHAVRDGYLPVNPVNGVKVPRENHRRDRILTASEYIRLLKNVSDRAPHMRPILVLAYETGMRRGEILGLRWKDLQRRPGFVYLPDTKNGASRWVPLNGEAREVLRAWPRRVDTDLVFVGPNGKPITTIKTAWKTLCGKARVEDIRFHDVRHTFTTRMLEAGVDIRSIMAITGHKSTSMFQRYSHPSDSHLKAAVETVSDSPLVTETVTVGMQTSGEAS